MEAALIRLPRYARGLKLVRIGVFLMLLQLGLSVVVLAKSLAGSDGESIIKLTQYFRWANIAGTGAMVVGSVLAVPDFRLARLPIRLVLLAVAGFAVATAAVWWTHHVLQVFIDVANDPDASGDDLMAALEGLSSLKFMAMTKDVAYAIGLIALIRTVRQSAVANDQDALRALASSVTGLIVIMLIGDVFYQGTYGLGSSGSVFPILGLAVGLGILGYWIYCHVRLNSFFESAAYFVNEPHHVPMVRLVNPDTVETDAPTPRPSARSIPREPTAPSFPSAPVIVVAAELRAAPVPRAGTSPGDESADGPRLLR
ncbi:hypothetical protein BH11MYX3_BH11MYX3_07560 [soil metagenome]